MSLTSRGMLLTALTATALFGAAATASAGPRIVHKTPQVPVVVDGVRYAPKQIHRFDGRPLYMLAENEKSLIAYTKLSRYKAALRARGVELPAPGAQPRARASYAGEAARVCTDRHGGGWCHNLGSGLGISNLNAISGCNFWGNCWYFDKNVEWIDYAPRTVWLFERQNFDPAYPAIGLMPGYRWDLTWIGWHNRASSMYMSWT
jgi:hypothetical protein